MPDEPLRRIERTSLPGVGERFAFRLGDGRHLSVLVHNTGRRELFLESADDPDASEHLVSLDERDSVLLAELLGGSQVVRGLERLQHVAPNLAFDWITVGNTSEAVGRSVGQLELRSTTGVTVVALRRRDHTDVTPGPATTLLAGDTVVVLGTPENIRRVTDLLRPG
ncbi:MAG: potassium transporter TrkA [Actinobacteria bacterium]|nr:potassium transporter TrkA [Actinomycetota bacterium]